MTKREIEDFFGVDDHDKGMDGKLGYILTPSASRRSGERLLVIDDQRRQSKNSLVSPNAKECNSTRRQLM